MNTTAVFHMGCCIITSVEPFGWKPVGSWIPWLFPLGQFNQV